ncbi:MAG: hypothetical protein ACK47B_10980 [Armatimonadota bacterium]
MVNCERCHDAPAEREVYFQARSRLRLLLCQRCIRSETARLGGSRFPLPRLELGRRLPPPDRAPEAYGGE